MSSLMSNLTTTKSATSKCRYLALDLTPCAHQQKRLLILHADDT
jgi:hypothetical protein